MEATATTPESPKRSTRIRAQIPLRLVSLDPSYQFSEPCHTLVVNPQGCGVRVSRPMEPGQVVQIEDLPTGHNAAATVANCVALGTGSKFWLVGLALHQPGNVWGIRPAPPDWDAQPKAMAAAVSAATPASKSSEWPYTQFSRRGEFHPGRR